jgi:aspartate aminotransferase-like enzyme
MSPAAVAVAVAVAACQCETATGMLAKVMRQSRLLAAERTIVMMLHDCFATPGLPEKALSCVPCY